MRSHFNGISKSVTLVRIISKRIGFGVYDDISVFHNRKIARMKNEKSEAHKRISVGQESKRIATTCKRLLIGLIETHKRSDQKSAKHSDVSNQQCREYALMNRIESESERKKRAAPMKESQWEGNKTDTKLYIFGVYARDYISNVEHCSFILRLHDQYRIECMHDWII